MTKIRISEEDMEDYYLSHKKDFIKPVRYKIQKITVKTEEESENTVKSLQAGATFSWLAKKKSVDSYASKDNEDYQLFDLKGDKQPIGFYWTETKFTTKYIPLQKGDSIYLFTDGFVDQKGGPNNKKFLSTNFKRSLLDIQTLSMDEQRQSLDDTLENWRKR